MRNFVILGRAASATGEFSLDDLPSTSGRLDVLLRCVRAALLVSHGLRSAVRVYLVLSAVPAPRVLRIDSASAKFVRPDERSLAVLIQKSLRAARDFGGPDFVEVRPGVALACGGLEAVIADLGPAQRYLLEEGAPDLRAQPIAADAAFFIGDHLGFDAVTKAQLLELSAHAIGVGPVSLHSDDVVTILSNELDRRSVSAEAGSAPR